MHFAAGRPAPETAVEFKVKLNECSDKYESRIRLLKEEQIQELAAKHQYTNTESPPPAPVKYCGLVHLSTSHRLPRCQCMQP